MNSELTKDAPQDAAGSRSDRLLALTALLILIATLIAATWIMIRNMGLVPGYDFGAGAYYYADIPEFQKYVDAPDYRSPVPAWTIYALFFAWGAAVCLIAKLLAKFFPAPKA